MTSTDPCNNCSKRSTCSQICPELKKLLPHIYEKSGIKPSDVKNQSYQGDESTNVPDNDRRVPLDVSIKSFKSAIDTDAEEGKGLKEDWTTGSEMDDDTPTENDDKKDKQPQVNYETPLARAQFEAFSKKDFKKFISEIIDRAIPYKGDPFKVYFISYLECQKMRAIARRVGLDKDTLHSKFKAITNKVLSELKKRKDIRMDLKDEGRKLSPRELKGYIPLESS